MKKNYFNLFSVILVVFYSFNLTAQEQFYADLSEVDGVITLDYDAMDTERQKPESERWVVSSAFPSGNTKDGKCFGVSKTFEFLNSNHIEFFLTKCDSLVIGGNIAEGRGVTVKIDDGDAIPVDGTSSCHEFMIPINKEVPVKISVTGIHNKNKAYVSLFSFYYAVKAPNIKEFSVNEISATIDQGEKTIEIELPFGTDLSNVTPVVTLGGTATNYTPQGAQDFTAGPVTYTATDDAEGSTAYTVNITVMAAADTEKSITDLTINGEQTIIDEESGIITIELPSYKGPLANWPIVFELNSITATSDFESGNSYDFASDPSLTITVTAQDLSTKVYTVTPTISSKKNVGLLSANGKAESYDAKLVSALDDYYVTFLKAETTAPADIETFYANYDVLLLHANVGGTNATGVATQALVGVKPILNLKAFFYNSGRWSWSSSNPQNAAAGSHSSEVEIKFQDHPIFENTVFDGTTLSFYDELPAGNGNAIQYASDLNTLSGMTSYTIATVNETGIHIHEIQDNPAAKFLMVGLSMENSNYTYFNQNAHNVIKNAIKYLLNSEVAYDYLPSSTQEIRDNKNVSYKDGIIHNATSMNVFVYNTSGVLVSTSKHESISTDFLSPGVYIIRTDNGQSLKFIK